MPILVERDERLSIVDIEHDARAKHQQPDPHYTAENRHEKPVDNIGDEFALTPPGYRAIAGPEVGEHGKQDSERDSDRHHLFDGLAEHQDDFHGESGRHDSLVESGPLRLLLHS